MTAGRQGRHASEQDSGSGIHPIRAEHTGGGGDLELTTGEGDADGPQVLRTRRSRREVVVGPHTVSVPDGRVNG